MDNTKVDYYFNDWKNDFLFPKIFSEVSFVWEGLVKKEAILNAISEPENLSTIDSTAVVKGLVQIGEGTVVGPYAVIEGPCIIGSNCLIRAHSYIRAGCIIGNDVVVGHGVEVKNSLIFNECKLDSHSFVGDSIFGRGVRNGSGTITANRRFDQKGIIVKIENNTFDSTLDKFGCVVGDYSRIGSNSTILPGTMIGQHVWVYPQTLIRGFIPSDTLIKVKQTQVTAGKARIELQSRDKSGSL